MSRTDVTRLPRDVDEKLTAFLFLKDNNNDPNLFNTESGVLVHVSRTTSHISQRFLARRLSILKVS